MSEPILCIESLRHEIENMYKKQNALKQRIIADQRKFRVLDRLFRETESSKKVELEELSKFHMNQNEIVNKLFTQAMKKPLVILKPNMATNKSDVQPENIVNSDKSLNISINELEKVKSMIISK